MSDLDFDALWPYLTHEERRARAEHRLFGEWIKSTQPIDVEDVRIQKRLQHGYEYVELDQAKHLHTLSPMRTFLMDDKEIWWIAIAADVPHPRDICRHGDWVNACPLCEYANVVGEEYRMENTT